MLVVFMSSNASDNLYSNTERKCNDLGKERAQKINKELNPIIKKSYGNIDIELSYSCYFNYFGLHIINYLEAENERPLRVVLANEVFDIFEKYTNNNPSLNDVSKYFVQFLINEANITDSKSGEINSPKISFDSYWFERKPSNQSFQPTADAAG